MIKTEYLQSALFLVLDHETEPQFDLLCFFCYKLLMSLVNPLAPVTGRSLDKILEFHALPAHIFEGATVFDLGCGQSDIAADLSELGIAAKVTGFDRSQRSIDVLSREDSQTTPVLTALDNLPVADQSADIVLATYSLPLWARTKTEIDRFFQECDRVVKIGGLLSVMPISCSLTVDELGPIDMDRLWEPSERRLYAKERARKIAFSANWLNMSIDPDRLTVRKIQ